MSLIRNTSFDIVHRLKQATSLVEVYTEMRSSADVFGYDTFMIGGLPTSPKENLVDCSLISGWPPGWAERYSEANHIHYDPVIRRIRSSVDPFCWADAAAADRTAKAKLVMNEAREFGLNEGLCVPFHELDGTEAGVSFGASKKFVEDEDSKAALLLVSMFAMSQARAIYRNSVTEDRYVEPTTGLSRREIECMKWAAAGKTAWEMSVILKISDRTVERHLSTAVRKLSSTNITQAVAKAMRQKIIE